MWQHAEKKKIIRDLGGIAANTRLNYFFVDLVELRLPDRSEDEVGFFGAGVGQRRLDSVAYSRPFGYDSSCRSLHFLPLVNSY